MRDPSRNICANVGKAKLAGIVLPEGVQLARCDLVALNQIRLGEPYAHVFLEAACDRGR
jgi:hypothetical protein